jgi:Beta-glucosidase-related glycosidases
MLFVKHFPGHGNTATDSHTRLPVIYGNKKDFSKIELPPFKSSVKNGVKMVMTAHVITPGIDRSKKPATLSSVITNGLLRKKLRFDGLVVTDAMEMGALNNIKSSEACVRAVEAGADIILLPLDVDSTINAIKEAVLSGRITEERINDSVKRIWLAKEELNLMVDKGIRDWEKSKLIIGNPNHINIANKIAQLSITVIKDKYDLLKKVSNYNNIAHLSITEDKNSQKYLLPMKNKLNGAYPDLKRNYCN